MLKALLVDDEELARRALANLIAECATSVVVHGSVAGAEEARHSIAANPPDVLFLDIEMPFEDGFSLLASIPPEERTFAVIFVTAYDHYALRAIRANALDYLVKPVDIDELAAALRKVERLALSRHRAQGAALTELIERVDLLRREEMRIPLPLSHELRMVPAAEVVRCEADNVYTTFVLQCGERVTVCRPIKSYEEMLARCNCLRVHKRHIVNLLAVVEVRREKEGETGTFLRLSNGEIVPVSRRRKGEVMARIRELGTTLPPHS